MTLRIGTRKSPLALWQAERVRGLLSARGQESELLRITTQGDRILDRSLAEVGGKGLFVQELEDAMAQGRADLAVHSAKDVPHTLPDGFVLSAFPQREDPRDALVAPSARTFEALRQGARVGTSSLRRALQLLAVRPDLVVVPIRGNVATRLARATGAPIVRDGVETRPAAADPLGPLDAVVLALAGLRRLGLEREVTQVLPVELCLPAAGQGALAIEALAGSAGHDATLPLDDVHVSRCVRAERALLVKIAGSCTVPIAAHCVAEGQALWLRAVLGGGSAAGAVELLRGEGRGADPDRLGLEVAQDLLARGGASLLAQPLPR